MRLTLENLDKAVEDIMFLETPVIKGSLNPMYADGFYYNSLRRKWGDIQELKKEIKRLKRIRETNPEAIGL